MGRATKRASQLCPVRRLCGNMAEQNNTISANNPFYRCLAPCLANEELAAAAVEHGSTLNDFSCPLQESVPTAKDRYGAVIGPFASPIDAPTPPERWFSPRTGWPRALLPPYTGGRPPQIMPIESDDPGLFLPRSRALGTLYVELLETDGLPHMDLGTIDKNDIFALLVFEDAAACTAPINDVNDPTWDPLRR